ncbi:MAG: SOS response-associated peptidase [bacterium]
MCGRFQLKFMPDAEELFWRYFGIAFPEFHYPPVLGDSLCPYNDISVIYKGAAGQPAVTNMFWNLIPNYEKRFEPKRNWFNIRKEKLAQPYTKKLVRARRCIIPVSGFFENKKSGGQYVYHSRKISGKNVRRKETYEFTHDGGALFALGGLYDTWNRDDKGPRDSCTIITLPPNELIAPIHDRMPFIVPKDVIDLWLDPSVDDFDLLCGLVKPYPSDKLRVRRAWPPEDEQPQADLFDAGE